MKEKNEDSEPDVIRPTECVYCHHTEFEAVQILGHGRFITRLAEMTLVGYLLGSTARYPLYGWRCQYCGYVMWFTARYLD